MIGDILLLESAAFSIEPSRFENGQLSDCPLGEGIAALIKSKLSGQEGKWAFNRIVLEDFGSVLMLSRESKLFSLTTCWMPTDKTENSWVIQFSQHHGCLRQLFRPKDDLDLLRELREDTQRVLHAEASTKNLKWISEIEYRHLE